MTKGVNLDKIILEFCNKALEDSQILSPWKQLNIIPVPKKGNLTMTENYCGIALTSIVTKTLNRMILNRITLHRTDTENSPEWTSQRKINYVPYSRPRKDH